MTDSGDRSSRRRTIVAVIGRSDEANRIDRDLARALGTGIIDAGYRLVTGGREGVMLAACEGGRASARWREGDIVGVIQGYDPNEANEACDIVIPTGMGLARNIMVVSTADVVIAIGGGSGTLSEIALAWQLGRPIIALSPGDEPSGWAHELAGRTIDKKRDDRIHAAADVQTALDTVSRIISRNRP